jgi:hypothetical protein
VQTVNIAERLQQATDVRACFSKSWGSIGRIIRWFTRGKTSHSFMTFALPDLPVREVLEATWPNVVIRPSLAGEANAGEYKPPAGVDLKAGLLVVAKLLGEPYDLGGLVGMAPVELLRRIGWHIANPLQSDRAEFCSELLCLAMHVAKWPGVEKLDPSTTDPEQLRRICEAAHG